MYICVTVKVRLVECVWRYFCKIYFKLKYCLIISDICHTVKFVICVSPYMVSVFEIGLRNRYWSSVFAYVWCAAHVLARLIVNFSCSRQCELNCVFFKQITRFYETHLSVCMCVCVPLFMWHPQQCRFLKHLQVLLMFQCNYRRCWGRHIDIDTHTSFVKCLCFLILRRPMIGWINYIINSTNRKLGRKIYCTSDYMCKMCACVWETRCLCDMVNIAGYCIEAFWSADKIVERNEIQCKNLLCWPCHIDNDTHTHIQSLILLWNKLYIFYLYNTKICAFYCILKNFTLKKFSTTPITQAYGNMCMHIGWCCEVCLRAEMQGNVQCC